MSYRSNISEPDNSNNSGDEITIINPYNSISCVVVIVAVAMHTATIHTTTQQRKN